MSSEDLPVPVRATYVLQFFSVSHADMDVDKDAFLEASKDIPR